MIERFKNRHVTFARRRGQIIFTDHKGKAVTIHLYGQWKGKSVEPLVRALFTVLRETMTRPDSRADLYHLNNAIRQLTKEPPNAN